MLAGVGPESWSAPGIAPAPLGTGALFSSGVILTCSSPTPGSSGTASPPAPTSGSGGSTAGGDLWLAFSAGSGAGGSTSGSTGGVSTDGPALSSQYTGGSGIGRITPLVYNPESDGAPVFHSGVFTGDHGSVQFVQTGDTGNQGTGEGDGSQSDDKSRARSWWGIRGWFLGDDHIDDGGSQVVQTGDTGRMQRGVGTTAGDWLDRNFGGGTFGEPDLSGRIWARLSSPWPKSISESLTV